MPTKTFSKKAKATLNRFFSTFTAHVNAIMAALKQLAL